jgi:hypothetical protein
LHHFVVHLDVALGRGDMRVKGKLFPFQGGSRAATECLLT